jgi:hypothetical protein
MIWNRDGKIWYSQELIDDIKELLEPILHSGKCFRCDGCGDTECGMFAAKRIMELIENA